MKITGFREQYLKHVKTCEYVHEENSATVTLIENMSLMGNRIILTPEKTLTVTKMKALSVN